MKLTLRRVGNSTGVIIPKATIDKWGLKEGDSLELRDDGIYPAARAPQKSDLDGLRLRRAIEIVRDFTPEQIRAKSLANLHNWKTRGSWVEAFDEWESILRSRDDGALFAAMLSRTEDATRLRLSAPYVGLLPPERVRALNEEVAA